MFQLNERLKSDTLEICDLSLCKVLLMKDANYPWLILVPQINDLEEIHHIPSDQQAMLWADIDIASKIMENLFKPTSMNVAALGNVVRQLHIHVVARYETDIAWPGPIWGQHPNKPYTDEDLDQRVEVIKNAFKQLQK